MVDNIQLLKQIAFKGLERRGLSEKGEYISRLEYELFVIEKRGYSDYFLVVADWVNWAKSQDIPIGPGRGSGAGSLLCYVLNITNVNPLEYNLLFERFLNPDRPSPPDLDIDVCYDRRHEVVEYLKNKYGEDHVAQIATLNKMEAAQSIRDTANVMGLEAKEGDRLAKNYAEVEAKKTLIEMAKSSKSEQDKKIYLMASRLQGTMRQVGKHAAGVVIADCPLDEIVAIKYDSNKGTMINPTVQADMETAEELGLLKMDVLGLKTLTTIKRVLDMTGIKSMEGIPLDDKKTYMQLGYGKTVGVFQLESYGMRNLVSDIQPQNITDIATVLALYRPGPLGSLDFTNEDIIQYGLEKMELEPDKKTKKYRVSMVDIYKWRRNRHVDTVYLHSSLEPILNWTYGVIVYQEQIIQIAHQLAGYSIAEADQFRAAVGKKNIEKLKKEKPRFIKGLQEHTGMDKKIAKQIYEQIEFFAAYGFNMCISGDTVVQRASANQYTGQDLTVQELYETWHGLNDKKHTYEAWRYGRGLRILAYDEELQRIVPKKVVNIFDQGIAFVYDIVTQSGKRLCCTANHRSFTDRGYIQTDEMQIGDKLLIHKGYEPQVNKVEGFSKNKSYGSHKGFPKGEMNPSYTGGHATRLKELAKQLPDYCEWCGESEKRLEKAHLDGDRTNNDRSNVIILCVSCHHKHDYRNNNRRGRWQKGHLTEWDEIVSIEYVGEEQVYDIEMEEPHNFVANGIVTHNSHSVSYAYLSYFTAYLKTNYPIAFYIARLNEAVTNKDKTSRYLSGAVQDGIRVLPPDINKSDVWYTQEGPCIRKGLLSVAGTGIQSVNKIISKRGNKPFKSLEDCAFRVGFTTFNKKIAEALITANAFSSMGHDTTLKNELDRIWEDSQYYKILDAKGQLMLY